jgi:hypothetical protein
MNIEKKVFEWMKLNGRPLELAQYKYLFENGSKDVLLNQLSRFQTENGGFAFGLEPDNINSHPSAIQTWAAMHYVAELELSESNPLISKMLDYLNKAMNSKGLFPATIPSNNRVPHAKWWDYDEESSIWGYNPSVALWAFIYKYRKGLKMKRYIVDALSSFVDHPTSEMHELKCFVDAYELLYDVRDDFLLFQVFESTLKNHVVSLLENVVIDDAAYGMTPLSLVQSPKDHIYQVIKPFAKNEINHLKKMIETNDMWDINFTWGQYEDAFKKAKIHWQSILAVKYMRFISDKH